MILRFGGESKGVKVRARGRRGRRRTADERVSFGSVLAGDLSVDGDSSSEQSDVW